MRKLNWTHYETRVTRALEAALEKVAPDATVPAEELLEVIMREDGFPVDGEEEIPETPAYYAMLVALEANGTIDLHPKRNLDGVIPGWGVTFPEKQEETLDWRKVLIAAAPALMAYLAAKAAEPCGPAVPGVADYDPFEGTLPTTIRPPYGRACARGFCGCKKAPSPQHATVLLHPFEDNLHELIRLSIKGVAATNPLALEAIGLQLTKEDAEVLAKEDLTEVSTWQKLSSATRDFLVATGLSIPDGYKPAPEEAPPPAPPAAPDSPKEST